VKRFTWRLHRFRQASPSPQTLPSRAAPDDVFIIQIETSLYQTANTHVLLAGCAQAKNIFWRVKTTTYIGADASMQGTLILLRDEN
jgi:hypothetical protein